MPKKFAGINSKAAAAKAQKAEKAENERIRKEKQEEDAKWVDDDKGANKKKERKEAAEKKKADLLEKKLEKQKLLAEEEANIKSKGPSSKKPAPSTKLTREQIRIRTEEQKKRDTKNDDAEPKTHLTQELEENVNRLSLNENEARNIEDAINVLSKESPAVDKHPEKRMKAAYEEFEKERLPQLKAENTNLRLSQLKQMLRKEWMKHPSNPMNKTLTDYNSK